MRCAGFSLLVLTVLIAGCASGIVVSPSARFVYSPYKHVTMGWRYDADALASRGVTALTLAFATGECGAESWDGANADDVAGALVPALGRAGIDYIVSTGGEAGTFTCASDEGMEAFIARYASPRLIGFDFDIERGQSDDILDALARRIRAARERHPRLRFSVTLATWAGSDAARAGLNPDGNRVLAGLRRAGAADVYVNLMVMDYGEARPGNCVVAGAVCDMGRSAVQAARNLHDRYAIALERIELTPMIGVNDVMANVFTLDDARILAGYVRDAGLAGVHFWSLDRDAACAGDARVVSSLCHGLPGLAPLAYTLVFRDALH